MAPGGVVVLSSTVPAAEARALAAKVAAPAVCSSTRRSAAGPWAPRAASSPSWRAAPRRRSPRRSRRCGHGGQGLPPGRRARRRLDGQGRQPAPGRRAHRGGGRGHGVRGPRRRRPAHPVRGDLQQCRQQLDVRQPGAAHAGRRLHPALGGRHLRQGSGPGARRRPRPALSAAAGRRGAPAVPDGGGGRPRPRGRRRRGQGVRAAGGDQRRAGA